MPKVVFIGAGSFGFTRNLVRDLLTYKSLRSSEIALVDINRRRLDFARRACQKLIDQGGTAPPLQRPPNVARFCQELTPCV